MGSQEGGVEFHTYVDCLINMCCHMSKYLHGSGQFFDIVSYCHCVLNG